MLRSSMIGSITILLIVLLVACGPEDVRAGVDNQVPTPTPSVREAPGRDCYFVNDVRWCRGRDYQTANISNETLVIGSTSGNRKTEMWGASPSSGWDCTFELTFHQGLPDSSVGLAIWNPREYAVTFRGGAVKVVSDGQVVRARAVSSYIGEPIKVHLKASNERVYAAINGQVLVDEPNTFWGEQTVWGEQGLRPRLNSDTEETITLHTSSCKTE